MTVDRGAPSSAGARKPRFASLLSSGEPPPYDVLRGDASAPQLVICDHASSRIPEALAHLGLDPEHRQSHIAVDIGAGDLARALGARLNATTVLCNYSRLVVDCNRATTDASIFLDLSGGIPVPGNMRISAAEREQRLESIYRPYHAAIHSQQERLRRVAEAPVLISIHSFTRFLEGEDRRWDCGVLWDLDARIARPLLDGLRADGDLLVGDNLPYSGRHKEDFSVDHHAEARRFPYAAVEVRQDLLDAPAAVEQMADRLYRVLRPILDNSQLYALRP